MEKHEKHAAEIFRRYMMQIHLLEIGRPSGVFSPWSYRRRVATVRIALFFARTSMLKTNLLGKQFPTSPKKLLGSIFSGEFAGKYASVPPKPGHHNMEEKKDGAKKINRFHINDRKQFFWRCFPCGPTSHQLFRIVSVFNGWVASMYKPSLLHID